MTTTVRPSPLRSMWLPGSAGCIAGACVLKVGGRTLGDPHLPAAISAWWRDRAGRGCVVHGGGDDVSALQRAMGTEPAFVGGRRVTRAAELDLLRMALSGVANKRLVSTLQAAGVPAVGLSGEDGRLLVATREDASLGHVGVPTGVNDSLLRALLQGGWMPVISPLSCDDRTPGAVLNVNADDAAAAIAVDLGASELLLIADVPGILVAGQPVPGLCASEVAHLLRTGVIRGGMMAKVESALTAVACGVTRVRVGDVTAIADATRGTTVLPDREAT